MKKFSPLYLLLLFAIMPLSQSFGQIITIGIKCGESKTLELSGTYYNVEAYTKDEATAAIKKRVGKKYSCITSGCDFPDTSRCKLKVTPPEATLTEDGSQWCFAGTVTISCGKCTEPNPLIGGQTGIGYQEQNNPDINTEHKQLYNNEVVNVYPNPTTGLVHLDLDIKEKGLNDVAILATDISGKQLFKKDYTKVSPSLLHSSIDLSALSNGMYFINVIVNGESIGTSKVSLL